MVGSYLFIDEPKVRSWEHQCHEAPLLAPPPPPPPPMTHAEMMAEMLGAQHESAHALEMLA